MEISFSIVVLFLKILLTQQSLDTPFTGGLGSYKLYVLVAHHIDRHLKLGGSDRPAEIVLSFLHRYGCPKTNIIHRSDGRHLRHCTTLHQTVPLEGPNGGSADLSNVYRLNECTSLFHKCYERLWSRVCHQSITGKDSGSILGEVIFAQRLATKRKLAYEQLEASTQQLQKVVRQMNRPSSSDMTLATGTAPVSAQLQRSISSVRGDLSTDEIVAGYNVNRKEFKSLLAHS